MRNILKQTSWLFFVQVLTRVISFFYIIFLAKTLGVAGFGLYSVALAYFSLFSSVADFGFNRFLVRELARSPKNLSQLVFNTAFLRIGLTSILFGAFSVIIYVLDPDKLRVALILLATIAIVPQSVSLTLDGIFVAFKKLKYSAISLLVLSISTAVLGLFLIFSGFESMGAVLALTWGQLIYLATIVLILIIQKKGLWSYFNTKLLRSIIIGSLPYGILVILGMVYFKIDIIFLSYFRGNYETGLYGTAYKFFEAVVFIPSSLSTALFPVFAKLHDHDIDRNKITKLYFQSLKILFALSLLILFVYVLLLPVIIRFLLPNYLPSIDAIKILSLAIPFMFMHFPAVQVLLSTDKYLKQILTLALFMLFFNIILNWIFIPKYGYIAASWVTVSSEALSFLIFFQLLTAKVFKKI